MDTTFSLGPVVIPGTVIVILAAGLSLRLVLRQLSTGHDNAVRWILDRGTTSLLVAFAAWKLWPLTTWWNEIVADPVILLRLPGGTTGAVVGGIAGLAVLVPGLIRERSRLIPFGAAVLGAVAGGFLTVAILGAIDDGLPTELSSSGVDLSVERLNPEYADRTGGNLSPRPDTGDTGDPRLLYLVNDTRPTVITFWATWCGPCRAELPVKQRFYREYASGTDRLAEFVAVNMTRTESSTEAVTRYLDEHDITYPVGLDRTGALSDRLSVRGTPTTIVVSASGDVMDRWTGPSSLERILRSIR
jgi:thiol-disulfide isomerase/thioredoxin